ncbi:Adhesion G-Protein Coupled Receptor F3 [Manis pentadactyla]|nr:Adhesion G-Protein Coupled Receptor F3 [Manis pentadactyla]
MMAVVSQYEGQQDSVLVSVHVELDFSNEAWLLALSRTPTLPTALASSPPRTLTSLSLTTVPGTLLLNSWLQMPGNTLNLTFLTSHETTDLNWLLWRTGNPSPVLLQPGSRVSLTSRPGQVVLSIFNISHEWAASLLNTSGHQCLALVILHCPEADTMYTCDLQSLQLTPLRVPVSVTIIQAFYRWRHHLPQGLLRYCLEVTKAGNVAQAPCPVNRTGMLLRARQGSPADEVPQILAQMREQVVAVDSPSDLLALLGTMTLVAKVVVNARVQLNYSAVEALLRTTDKVLDMDSSSLWTPVQAQRPLLCSGLLLALETLARSLCPQDHPFSFSLSKVQLQTQLLGPTFPADYRVSFSTLPPLEVQIPGSSLAPLGRVGTNISITRLMLQKLDRLLPSNYGQGLGDSFYATPGLLFAISIMAGGQACNQGEVIIDFGDTDGTPHCVFWDHDLFRGKGGWSDEGCQVQAARTSPTTQCICRHLTAFSILMSQYTVPENPTLELLTQVGLGASILALLVCLGVYRLVWRVVVRNNVAYLRHVALLNMVLCLLAADTCFLGTPLLPPGPQSPLCLAAAFLCHFLYLATIFCLLAQALMLAHQLLFVFHQLSKHRVLSLMVVLGSLCPMGFAGVALGLYLLRGQYLGEGACWLDGRGGTLYTFVGPVLAIVSTGWY